MNRSNDLPDAFILLQRIHRWRMAFFSVIILLAGTMIGASGMFIWNRHRLTKPRTQPVAKASNQQKKNTPPSTSTPWVAMGKRLDRHLELTDEQSKELLRVLRQHWTQLDKIKLEARPRIREELLAMNEKVIAMLNDKQKSLWRQDFRRLQQQFQLDYRPQPQTRRPTPGRDERSDKDASAAQHDSPPAESQKKPTDRSKTEPHTRRSDVDPATQKKPTP
jgi:hypothetical protein